MVRLSHRSENKKKGLPSLLAPGKGLVASACKSFHVFPPWDILRGRDVFRDVEPFEYETLNADLAHFAPNCATDIPIKGVEMPPKAH